MSRPTVMKSFLKLEVVWKDENQEGQAILEGINGYRWVRKSLNDRGRNGKVHRTANNETVV